MATPPPPPAKTIPPAPVKVGGVASAAAAFGAPAKAATPASPVPVKAAVPVAPSVPAKAAVAPSKVGVPVAPAPPVKVASPVGATTATPAKAAVPVAPAVPAKTVAPVVAAKTAAPVVPAKVGTPPIAAAAAKRALETKTPATAAGSTLRTAGVVGFSAKDATAAKGDQKTLENKMQQMSNLTNDRRAARKVARNKDTIAGLMNALNNSPKFTKMVEYSVTCIKNLAVDVTSAIELVDEGVVESLLNVLNLNPFNERIQELVNGALSSLCMTPELAQLVGDKLGTKALLRSMKQHQSQETLVSDCKAMVNLFKSSKNVDAFVKDGAVDALAGVVTNCKGNLEIMTAATTCLNRIADNKAYAAEIMASGQVEAILNAMRANPGNAELAEQGIAMISKLAKASPEILAQLRKLGAVDIIVELLEAHPDNKTLIALGATALGSLADKSDVSSALSKITQGTSTSETASALSKLSSLMLVAENVDHMVKNEGIGWLISALSSAVNDQSEIAGKILFSGCQALMRCAVDESRIYQIMQKGGVKLLISVINSHVKDEKIACAALAALTKILSRKENAQFIVKSNGIAAALAILKEHPDSEKAAKGVLEFFQRMAAFDDCVPAMIAAGVTEAIVGIMKNHSGNAEILTGAINTLGRMATSAENVTRMATAGALETIVHALQDHKEDVNLAKQAILLLETAALVPANLEQLRKLGAVAAVLAALGAHPEDKAFQDLGARCMQQLQGEGQLKEAVDSVGVLSRGMVGATATTNLPKLMSAVSTISNLALVEENIAALIKNGAVDALVGAFAAAMKLTPSTKRDEVLTGAAAALLRLAAKDAGVQVSLVKGNVLKDMLKGALACPQNEELAEHVMNLVALCASNPANILKMVADGSIEDIIALAKAHPLNEKILAQATKALGLMATSPENILRIIRNGGAEVVVESIFANIENEAALMNALEVLQQLAIDEESINALVRAGAVDAILEAMRAHPNNPAILSSCMQALCRLLISEEIALSVGEKGGVPLFVKAMRQHYTTEPLCEVDMVLLDSLASLPENAKRLLEPALTSVELIKYIAAAYPQNTVLVEAAAKLVTALTGATAGEGSTTTPILQMSDEAAHLKSASVEVLMDKLKGKGKGVKAGDLQALMATIEASAMNPDGARTMVEKGGLQALAAVMKQSKDNEAVFYAASAAFLALADNGGDGVIVALEDPLCIDALCDMMNAHEIFANPMSLNDLTKAIGCVAKLKMNGTNVNAMLKNAPLASLLKIFAQSDDPVLLAQAARLLGKLSNNEEAQAFLHKIVNIRELIAAMRRNIKNEEFLKYGAFLLGNLAQNETVQGQIGIEGGVQLLLQIMEMYAKNAGLVENCVFALANLSYQNDVNCSFIVACRGIPAIIGAVNTHTKAEEMLDSSIVTLNNLCRNNDPNKVAIVKAGGAQAIVDTILNNFNAMDLLLTCFRTMGNLAFDSKTIDTIIKAGGVQGIVAGMTVHTEEADVIDIAVRVLTNMSADLDDENMAVLAQEGAVQAVVEVANQYTDNAEIEVSAMNCLFNLARTLENAKIMIYQGISKSCLKTMKTLEYAADVVDPTLRLLHSLTGCTNELERLLESGVTAGIVAAVNANKTDKAIIPSGFGAIGNMATNSDAATKLATEGPIECVLGVISECSGDPEILAECYACLSHLTRSQQNAEAMAAGAQRAMVGSLRAHGGNAGFLPAPFSFLANLCVHKGAAEAAIDSGVVPAIVAVLKKHPADGGVQIKGLRAIENVCHGSQNVKDYCKREGLEATVQAISDANAAKDDVRRACKGVLDALRGRLEIVSTPFVSLKPNQVEKKSLKDKLGDNENKGPAAELKIEVKNFLLAGQLIVKHSKTAKPKSRHVYVDAELKNLVWKDPKKPLHPKNKMKIYKIRSMERGRVTPQLQRKTAFGKFLAKDECSLAIMGRERSVDLEMKNETERDKWMSCIQQLIDYKKAMKAEATKFDAR
jgi:hypothetical protein